MMFIIWLFFENIRAFVYIPTDYNSVLWDFMDFKKIYSNLFVFIIVILIDFAHFGFWIIGVYLKFEMIFIYLILLVLSVFSESDSD